MSEYQKEREEEREGWVSGGLIGIWDKKNLLISLIYSLNLLNQDTNSEVLSVLPL